MYETENDNDVAVLMAVIETADDAIDTEGVIRLLRELTDARKTVAKLTARNAELLDHSNCLLAAIDAERESYQRVLANRDREIADVRSLLDTREDDLAYWKQRANELSDRMTADVQPLLVGDPLVMAAQVYRDAKGEPTSRKITVIKALRSYTGLGLREAKLAVEQVIKIVEMKE